METISVYKRDTMRTKISAFADLVGVDCIFENENQYSNVVTQLNDFRDNVNERPEGGVDVRFCCLLSFRFAFYLLSQD
jgi:hypothetical protein